MATYSIAAGADDGYATSGSSIQKTASSMAVGDIAGTKYRTWLRFTGIAADQGATCASAYITFYGGIAGSGTINTAFYGVDEDNHAAPTTFAEWDTDHGIHTTAKVDWDFSDGTSVGDVMTSPSLVSIFDEIFARGGWTTGNAIGIHWDDDATSTSCYRRPVAYESTAYPEPVLTLTLNAGGGLKIPVAMHSYRQRRV